MCMTVPLSILNKKINIFVGTAGSGKSEIALNLALELSDFLPINLIDADIVNFYYNIRNIHHIVDGKGIKFITTHFEDKGIDLPILAGDVASALASENSVSIIDVGGDELGSVVLGQFRDIIRQKGSNLFYVANIYRPENSNIDLMLENIEQIEEVIGIRINGIINNSHLLEKTKKQEVIDSLKLVQEVANIKCTPYVLTVINEELFDDDLVEEIKKYSLVYAIKRYIIREIK